MDGWMPLKGDDRTGDKGSETGSRNRAAGANRRLGSRSRVARQ